MGEDLTKLKKSVEHIKKIIKSAKEQSGKKVEETKK
jgi:16S rRNA U1498 N3-methylase RsmE